MIEALDKDGRVFHSWEKKGLTYTLTGNKNVASLRTEDGGCATTNLELIDLPNLESLGNLERIIGYVTIDRCPKLLSLGHLKKVSLHLDIQQAIGIEDLGALACVSSLLLGNFVYASSVDTIHAKALTLNPRTVPPLNVETGRLTFWDGYREKRQGQYMDTLRKIAAMPLTELIAYEAKLRLCPDYSFLEPMITAKKKGLI